MTHKEFLDRIALVLNFKPPEGVTMAIVAFPTTHEFRVAFKRCCRVCQTTFYADESMDGFSVLLEKSVRDVQRQYKKSHGDNKDFHKSQSIDSFISLMNKIMTQLEPEQPEQ